MQPILTFNARQTAVDIATWTTLVNHVVKGLFGRVAIGSDRQLPVCVVCVCVSEVVGRKGK